MQPPKALLLTTIICSLLITTSAISQESSPPEITLKEEVVLLSQPPPGSTILPLSAVASPDLSKLAYSIRKDEGGFVIVNDAVGAQHDAVGAPLFSADSQRVAYLAYRGRHMFVVLDGKAGKLYDKVEYLKFSPDSKRFAYLATQGDEYLLVIDGNEDPPYDEIWHSLFSPDSSRFVYGARKRKKWFVVESGKETEVIGGDLHFRFSPDSRRLAYTLGRRRGFVIQRYESFAVVDRKRFGPYGAFFMPLLFSPDSKHYAFSVGRGLGGAPAILVWDGKETQTPYDYIHDFVFSPDSRRLAYRGTASGKQTVILDGREIPGNVDMSPIAFTPDSSQLAYCESRPDAVSVVIGDTEMLLPTPLYLGPFLTPDFSTALGVVRDDDKMYVVVTGSTELQSEPYEDISSLSHHVFSPDSAHFAYTAKKDGEWLMVVDGVEGKQRFYEMVAPPVFDSPTHVRMIAVQQPGHRFTRLEVQILPAAEQTEE